MIAPRSLAEVRKNITSGKYTLIELTQFYIDNAHSKKHLNAFLELWEPEALERAEKIQLKINNGTAGKLAGAVIGLKDNICYAGHKVSASSKILGGFESLYSSTAVERMLAEDALFIGRLNCDEFAMGSSNENSAFGVVLNPWNEKAVPGGSSGGSAVAVAADMCLMSLGSDTGGSIRQPASFCGIVGMKPTYGRVSRHGLIAYASSMDQIGPFAHSVTDAALLLEVIAGADEFDNTSSNQPVGELTPNNDSQKPLKIAYLNECINAKGLDTEVKNKHLQLFENLKAKGHTVEGVDFPYLDQLVPTYNVLSNAEASSNLSRFDGMRYGYRSENAHDIDSTYFTSRSEGFGREVKRRIMLGTFVLSAGYYDAYYSKAQKVRRLIQEKTNQILSQYEFIITPTTPHTAFEIGSKGSDPVAMYLEDIFTVQANLAGVPGISLPLFTHSNGMPFGTQIMAKMFDEKKLLAFSSILMNS